MVQRNRREKKKRWEENQKTHRARKGTEPLNQVEEDILFDHPDTTTLPFLCSPVVQQIPSFLWRLLSNADAHCVHYTTHSNIYARQKTHLQLTTHTASLASSLHLRPSFTHLSSIFHPLAPLPQTLFTHSLTVRSTGVSFST